MLKVLEVVDCLVSYPVFYETNIIHKENFVKYFLFSLKTFSLTNHLHAFIMWDMEVILHE